MRAVLIKIEIWAVAKNKAPLLSVVQLPWLRLAEAVIHPKTIRFITNQASSLNEMYTKCYTFYGMVRKHHGEHVL